MPGSIQLLCHQWLWINRSCSRSIWYEWVFTITDCVYTTLFLRGVAKVQYMGEGAPPSVTTHWKEHGIMRTCWNYKYMRLASRECKCDGQGYLTLKNTYGKLFLRSPFARGQVTTICTLRTADRRMRQRSRLGHSPWIIPGSSTQCRTYHKKCAIHFSRNTAMFSFYTSFLG